MDNKTINDVKTLVLWHDFGIGGPLSKKGVRKMLSKMGEEYFDQYLEIKYADIAGQSDYRLSQRKKVVEDTVRYHDEIVAEGDALSIKELQINGKDLMNMGIKPGPEMGKILNELMEKVLEKPELNKKELLAAEVADKYLKMKGR